ncbi:DUF418 domain-containing protein [Agrobacterium sp. T29]|uniref:DUF418 domain-containing protein n=1 Tax=Agrobacterium sp. T29 TaxID=2580515 RepID=UPI00115F2846|nr:DUF418 domain-containing protein [Agrobacterium sp. T29]
MNDRIANMDAIRGFALFGILVVNILAFSSVWYGSGFPAPGNRSVLDEVLAFLVSALFELKFYLLFSFLFGYSVTLQMQSAEKAGATFLPRMMRRQAGLFLIGILHAVFLFHGDILSTYAILGFTLLALRHLRGQTKLRLALLLVLATALFWLVLAWLQGAAVPPPFDPAALNADAAASIAAWRGGPLTVVGEHLAALEDFLPLLLLLQAPCAFAMFLVGFVAGRKRLFLHRDVYGPLLNQSLAWGLLIGLPGGLIYATAAQYAPGTAVETAGIALSILTSPFLSLAILAGLLKLLDSGRVERLRDCFASLGRMALSNYLLQSLTCAFIFHGYGLGLVDRLAISQVLGLGVLVFIMQMLLSCWWMNRFHYGPLEWLLRAATVWHYPGWRKKVTKQGEPARDNRR